MTIAEIGTNFKTTTKIPYLSSQTFLDFDLIILDYVQVLSSFDANQYSLFMQRKEALSEFLKYKKKPLIVFAPEPRVLQFHIHSA